MVHVCLLMQNSRMENMFLRSYQYFKIIFKTVFALGAYPVTIVRMIDMKIQIIKVFKDIDYFPLL